MSGFTIPRCAHCGEPLPVSTGSAGRPRQYCDSKCRQRKHRARRAQRHWDAIQPGEWGSDAVEGWGGDLQSLDAVEGWGSDACAQDEWGAGLQSLEVPEAPPGITPDEQIARAILEAQGLAAVFARLGIEGRPQLAWRCTKYSELLAEGLREYFDPAGDP